jgi:hypothetical protein
MAVWAADGWESQDGFELVCGSLEETRSMVQTEAAGTALREVKHSGGATTANGVESDSERWGWRAHALDGIRELSREDDNSNERG